MALVRKDVVKLAAPIFVEQLFVTLMGMINTMMAGHIGKEAVSAIGMIDSINNIFIAFFSALAVGGTVVVAQYIGQNNIKKANESTKQALYSTIIIAFVITIIMAILKGPLLGFLFGSAEKEVILDANSYFGITLLTYPLITIDLVSNGILRGAGDTKTPMKISILMNVLNVAFTALFIWGIKINGTVVVKSLGITGAALGIATARTIGGIIILIVMVRGSRIVQLKKLTEFKFDMTLLKPIFGIGVPASVESLLFNGGKLIMQIFIVGMGTVAMASNTIVNSISNFLNIPGNSLVIAATALVGQHMGRDDDKGAEKCLSYITKLSTVLLAIVGILSILFSRHLPSLYTGNNDIIKLSSKVLIANAFAMIIWSSAFTLPAGLKGAGDAKYTMVTSIIGMWLFRIVLGNFLGNTMKFGLLGIFLGMYTDWLVRGILYIIRFRSGKWKNHVVVKRVKTSVKA
ncbi:putative MATE family efflux protein [Clostridium acetobutylicum]|uniref:MATE family efflux transporter n=1 Tax=Clostridium TaxID=1485 RepID=UPI000212AA7F|nr:MULTISPECIES: MATE family efflux transporter [Clostridium]AEI31893.1 cation efflux pump (multidrug resistance protein) [Clostridium acetobutylicum DSM 1731]AWV79982.1 MATE family efflux transporter [Clostridium acetobutylicum]MBC2394031.1 MATE family efflux transporter [Clostridium acetobutylicum]MBC2586690.1 MATE family efflux transporter [Clostridium acetobutylicum]NOV90438.1 putative MATE family efflux protein [Clostridium acetobutylicum]